MDPIHSLQNSSMICIFEILFLQVIWWEYLLIQGNPYLKAIWPLALLSKYASQMALNF